MNLLQKFRFGFQITFSIICTWIGIEFYFFIQFLETSGASGSFYRPPGAEGFLPISSLMNLRYFFEFGKVHPFHPAGFFLLSAFITISLAFSKSFCGWICPIGTISEFIADAGEKILKHKIKVNRILDYFLRSIKYIFLLFFVYIIFLKMDATRIKDFLDSDYNLMSDIKMYHFFADISQFAMIVITLLFIGSIFIRNLWCRYLCPLGGFMGIIGLLSPFKITRNKKTCIDCSICINVCPSNIKVEKVNFVLSDECNSCFNCISACPQKDTLEIKLLKTGKKINHGIAWIIIATIFLFFLFLAFILNKWHNNYPIEKYIKKHQNIEQLGHPYS